MFGAGIGYMERQTSGDTLKLPLVHNRRLT